QEANQESQKTSSTNVNDYVLALESNFNKKNIKEQGDNQIQSPEVTSANIQTNVQNIPSINAQPPILNNAMEAKTDERELRLKKDMRLKALASRT
ncbi:hypothetical protein CFT13S00388_09930, partial [Campylobacter fetus subsp. testudinum]